MLSSLSQPTIQTSIVVSFSVEQQLIWQWMCNSWRTAKSTTYIVWTSFYFSIYSFVCFTMRCCQISRTIRCVFGGLHKSMCNKVVCSSFKKEEWLKSGIKAQIFLVSKCICSQLNFRFARLAAALFDVNVAFCFLCLALSFPALHFHFFLHGFYFLTAEARLQHFIFLHRVPVNKGRSKSYINVDRIQVQMSSLWWTCLKNSLWGGLATASAAVGQLHWPHWLAGAFLQRDGLLVHHAVLTRSTWCGGRGWGHHTSTGDNIGDNNKFATNACVFKAYWPVHVVRLGALNSW